MLIPTLEVKTHNRRHIHLNMDISVLNIYEEKRDIRMLHIIITQYALKTGLRKLKKQVESSVTKELTQLYVLETFAPVGTTKLTKKQRT